MKILEVINSLSYRGGAQTLFAHLCEELSKINEEPIHLLVLYDRVDDSFDFLKKKNNIVFHTIDKRSSFDFKAAKKLKSLIEEISPDVINFHLSFLPTYFLAFGFKKRSWKLIKTYHSIPNKDTNKFDIFLQKRYVKKEMLSFIGISENITLISKKLYPHAEIKTINNGVIPFEANNQNNTKEYDFVIVASFTEVKNHKLLFDAFEQYLVNKPNAKLLCIGDGVLLKRYMDLVKEKKMENNIIFAGNQNDVYSFLMISKTFVLSSLREGNPISILEALSVGLPVIAPRIGGIPDIIEEGINGLLYNCNNEAELLDNMVKINESNLFNKISFNNLEKSKRFLISQTAFEYLEYFNSLKCK